jgi:hypothetical protein
MTQQTTDMARLLGLPEEELDTDPLVSSPFMEWISRLLKSPCRSSTRLVVSTRQYKARVAASFVEHVTNDS